MAAGTEVVVGGHVVEVMSCSESGSDSGTPVIDQETGRWIEVKASGFVTMARGFVVVTKVKSWRNRWEIVSVASSVLSVQMVEICCCSKIFLFSACVLSACAV